MARINTNISSMLARSNLARTSADLDVRLQRLATGLRINRGADDPAGLIVSERLRSEIKGIDQAIANSERASSVIATTEGYLAEVADLLNSIKGLIVEAANSGGVSAEEIAALSGGDAAQEAEPTYMEIAIREAMEKAKSRKAEPKAKKAKSSGLQAEQEDLLARTLEKKGNSAR